MRSAPCDTQRPSLHRLNEQLADCTAVVGSGLQLCPPTSFGEIPGGESHLELSSLARFEAALPLVQHAGAWVGGVVGADGVARWLSGGAVTAVERAAPYSVWRDEEPDGSTGENFLALSDEGLIDIRRNEPSIADVACTVAPGTAVAPFCSLATGTIHVCSREGRGAVATCFAAGAIGLAVLQDEVDAAAVAGRSGLAIVAGSDDDDDGGEGVWGVPGDRVVTLPTLGNWQAGQPSFFLGPRCLAFGPNGFVGRSCDDVLPLVCSEAGGLVVRPATTHAQGSSNCADFASVFGPLPSRAAITSLESIVDADVWLDGNNDGRGELRWGDGTLIEAELR